MSVRTPSLDPLGPRPDGATLVGGAVRDLCLDRAPRDLDWRVPDPASAAEAFAAHLGGTAFALDAARGHWRVVRGAERHDLVPAEAPLEDDLAGRDFTVNAMALGEAGLVDPHGGRADLEAGVLRAVGPTSLADDPLRGLRGVRLAAALDLTWAPATWAQAQEVTERLARHALALPAPERVGEELRALLTGPAPARALREARHLGWLALALPELLEGDGVDGGGLHHLDVLQHALEVVRLVAAGHPDLPDPDDPEPVRWAALLHDVAKPRCRTTESDGTVHFRGHDDVGAEMAARALRRLRVPGPIVRRTAALVKAHMIQIPASEREERRFLHRRRALLPDLAALMIADRGAARGPASSEASRRRDEAALLRVVERLRAPPPPAARPPLVDGHDVMAWLGLEPGPRVGEALRFVREAEALGDVRGRAEARRALRRYARTQGWLPPAPATPPQRRRLGRARWLAFAPSLVLGGAGAILFALRPEALDPRWGWAPALALGLAVGGVLLAAGAWLERRLASFRWASQQMDAALRALNPSRPVALGLAAATAVGEELLFRGVLLPAVGLVPQALLFGALHPVGRKGWSYPVFAVVAGLAFGGLVLATGRLLPAIVAHALVNGVGLLGTTRQAEPARSRRSMP